MSFSHHTNCTSCGSSDGNAVYDDGGSFCFVCRKASGGNPLKRLTEARTKAGRGVDQCETKELPQEALDWLSQYGLTDAEKAEFSWHPVRKHLIFRDGDFYNARNFGEGPKYVSYGTKPYRVRGTGVPLVVVEDAVSGIRLSRQVSVLILYGTVLPAGKRILHGRVSIWLDKDAVGKAVDLCYQLRSIGCDASVIYSDLDPKSYSDQEIARYLNISYREGINAPIASLPTQ